MHIMAVVPFFVTRTRWPWFCSLQWESLKWSITCLDYKNCCWYAKHARSSNCPYPGSHVVFGTENSQWLGSEWLLLIEACSLVCARPVVCACLAKCEEIVFLELQWCYWNVQNLAGFRRRMQSLRSSPKGTCWSAKVTPAINQNNQLEVYPTEAA